MSHHVEWKAGNSTRGEAGEGEMIRIIPLGIHIPARKVLT